MEGTLFHHKKTNQKPNRIKEEELGTLVLTRRVQEKIFIDVDGEIVEVIFGEITRNNQIRLIFRASKKVRIIREELVNRPIGNRA